jgi:biopolymer transport protein ExbD
MLPGSNDQESGLVTGINMTPLVDITLVLLIIFMVTATFMSEQALVVNLPKVAAREDAPTPAITVTLGANGQLKLMRKDTDLQGLRDQMAVEFRLNPQVKVLVKADKDIPYGKLAEVLDAIKQGGIQKVALSMDRK